MRVLNRIGWEHLHMPATFIGFVRRDPTLARFVRKRPGSAAELLERAADRLAWRGIGPTRDAVAATLARYAERHGAPAPVLYAAERAALPGTVAIVTGQQPGLFGGPLYVWHKIATALRLAREIRAIPGAPAVVTIFWNHSDDHDWGEANHTYLLNPALDVQRVRLRLPTTGKPLSAIPVGEDVSQAIDEARDLLPATDATEAELAALRPAGDDDTIADLTARLFFRHFGDEGLLVLEPAELDEALTEPLRAYHADAEGARADLESTAAELVDRGFDVTVDPDTPFLFRIDAEGKRRGVPDGDDVPAGQRLSPGVLLRNLWQDALLPTLAYVAGPGEVSYLALSRPLYARFDVPMPDLVPRVSLTHVTPKLAQRLREWRLSLPELERGAKLVEEEIASRFEPEEPRQDEGGIVEDDLAAAADELRERLRGLEERIAEVDPNLRHPLARIASRAGSDLKKFAQRVSNQRRNRAGRYRQHARRLCGELMPRGRLQERVFPALPFLVREPDGFVRELIDVADPFADAHLLVGEE